LGLLYIAAVTRNKGYNVKITDLRGKKGDLIKHLNIDSDVYGFTSSTPSYYNASGLAKKIKKENPKALTVLGGIHATSLPYEIGDEFDKIIIGEGERSFLNLLKDIENKDISRKFYNSNVISDLDSIPFPARDILPFDSTFSRNAFSVGGDYAGTIITTRGCPGKCSFCGSQIMWGKKVRFRSPNNIVKEIEEMIDNYSIKHFRFQDDTMVLKKKRLFELCNKIEPLGIKWRATTRVDKADIKSLNIMKQAGCEEVGFGIESLDQNVLNKNQKGTRVEQFYDALENARNAGLKTRLFFIVGLPGEKPGFSKRLERFLKEVDPDGVDVSTLVPYPGSPIFHYPEKFGIKLKEPEFEKYHMSLGFKGDELNRPLTFEHDILSEEEILEERRKSLEIILSRKKVKNF
jgi:anaerobic magnesium-protoporphyrin IX monomethyl ester cyclase